MGEIMGLMQLILILLRSCTSIMFLFCVPKAIHIFQQESYQFRDYFRWITKNPKKAFGEGLFELASTLIFFALMALIDVYITRFNFSDEIKTFIYLVQLICLYVIFYTGAIKLAIKWKRERKNAKKKLVYTGRVKRLLFFIWVIYILVESSLNLQFYSLGLLENACMQYAQPTWQFGIMIITMPAVLILASIIAYPLETLINDHYINSARWKIIRPKYSHLIRIGITGSYGKTSTKFILKTILSEKYNVLATPESYNTTMGNVKIIRNELKPEHQVFISEMGARYPGDIRKICDFVYPQIGIITSIGPQHLESFKTVEKVAKTKSELLRSLPVKGESENLAQMYSSLNKNAFKKDSAIFLPVDGAFCSELYKNEKNRTKFSYSVSDKSASVYAKNIKMSSEGCEFTAVTPIGDIKCVSKLLGELNIQNILGAIAIAVYLDLSKEQIARGVSKIEPVAHRLQILPSNNGTIVIDDAFNSNPVGSKMALDVLKEFKDRKIVITPGMVELGQKEEFYNSEFGKHMAKCTDIAILVGMKRSKPIEKGLLDAGFDSMNIYVVPDLNAATRKLAEITNVGDVVLFENDLPDNYNE